MNPWLVTWKPMDERAEKTVPNRIAAILPNRTPEKEVNTILYLLLANYSARSGLSENIYVSEQVRFGKRDNPYKAVSDFFHQIHCGGNPCLFARKVFNLKVVEKDDFEILHWEENIYPALLPDLDAYEQIKGKLPFKRKKMMFSTKTNKITRLPEPDTGE